jgi:hypothetical protein
MRFYAPLFDDCQLITYYRAGYNGSTHLTTFGLFPEGHRAVDDAIWEALTMQRQRLIFDVSRAGAF